MIHTGFESRVKVQDILINQLPDFIMAESPKTLDFLKQYYISQEFQGAPTNIVENLDQYLKLDNLTPDVIVGSTELSFDIESDSSVIYVSSTSGFPEKYGLLKIDDEIITYTGKDDLSFTGCVRGFSGITSYHAELDEEELVFSSSTASSHSGGVSVENLSSLFLKEFYRKLKYTFAPGFEERQFVSDLDAGNFIKQAKNFYESKGTENSFEILFRILFGEDPKVINLEERLLKPSSAEFIRREIVIAEAITGNPLNLIGQTIFKSDDADTNASISEVDIFTRKGVEYYKLALFVGYSESSAIQGTFEITPNTKSFDEVTPGSTVITVDSTIGFSESGTIQSGNNVITYTEKNINQFLGCNGISETINKTDNIFSQEKIYFGYENGETDKLVQLRLTGIISDFKQKSSSVFASEGQILTVRNIGDKIENFGPGEEKTYKQIFANSWIYNSSSSIEIDSFSGSTITLKKSVDRSQLKKGDQVEIIDRSTNSVVYPTTDDIPYVKQSISFGSKTVILENFSFIPGANTLYSLRRRINKSNSEYTEFKYGNDTIISDIQNLYSDGDFAYVASNSLPSAGVAYTDFTHNIKISLNESILNLDPNSPAGQLTDFDVDGFTTISFDKDVDFVTGDRIYYQPTQNETLGGLEVGFYYVEVLANRKNIKLYSASSSVGKSSNVLKISNPLTELSSHIFTIDSQNNRLLNSQNILKKFPLYQNIENGTNEDTLPGSTGMLINGVEILNYKTTDIIYYGPIDSVSVLNSGSGYDVINPPQIEISSGLGSTALVNPILSGTITEIFVDQQEFDIDEVLSVNVSGGNVSGGKFEPIVTTRKREILFDARSTSNGGGISTTTSQLTFLKNHNLSDGDEVFYNNNDNPNVSIGIGLSSLTNQSSYFIAVDNNTTIRLFDSYDNYLVNNPISFATTSLSGTHKFTTGNFRKTVSEIKVVDGGSLTNRELYVKSSGISTTNNLVNFKNHGFKSGELVEYAGAQDSSQQIKVGGIAGKFFNGTSWRSVISTGNIGTIPLTTDNDSSNVTGSAGMPDASYRFGVKVWPYIDFGPSIGNNYGWIGIGYFIPPVSGTYRFSTRSDDGSGVWIGDLALEGATRTKANAVVDNGMGTGHGAVTVTGDIALTAGVIYPIRIVHEEGGGGDEMDFKWRVEGGTGSEPGLNGTFTTDLTKYFYYGATSSGTVTGDFGGTLPIIGISTTNLYYALKIDDDSFRLCDAGIGGTITENLNQEKFIKFSDTGNGYQVFKYPDITVTLEYTSTGIGTTQSNSINLTPVVKGEIVDLSLYETGTGYGSSIINEERLPQFTIKNGKEAQVEPIIINGSITDVNLQFGGFEYFSVPNLEIRDPSGKGTGAKLRAIVSNGELSDVKIINPGIGYSTSSTINVVSSGSNAQFTSSVRKLYVNNVEKTQPNPQYQTFENRGENVQYFISGYSDNIRKTFVDNGSAFSKIIGWAYDGNPIYGSFGYNDPNDSNLGIKTLTSGYSKDLSNIFDRPSGFDLGFFVDDYRYDASGDLDINNGRFAKTPEFPEGIYAYHATINPDTLLPEFPYFIGNSFRSKLIQENEILNQSFDFNNSSLIRNTYPHNISETFADNNFIVESDEIIRQKTVVESISKGSVSGFDIINPGDDYKVGDELIFDNENTGGGQIKAQISAIQGKSLNQIDTSIETFSNTIFIWNESKVKGYVLPYHNLQNLDYITVSGFGTSKTSKLNDYHQITINPNPIIGLTTEIVGSGSTSTEIYVTSIPSNVSSGNSIGIGTEILEVLNVYPNKNILRVKRGLVGTSHTVGESVVIKNNSFTIDLELDYFESNLNEKIYFNPRESVGLGTTAGVGYSTSFTFGNESINRDIPTQRLYIENHPFRTNQKVTFNSNGHASLSIGNSPTDSFPIDSTLYIVNKSPNTIGVKTGITSEFGEVYFRSNGENFDDYYFETTYEQELGDIEKVTSVVSVSTSHGLSDGDKISLTVKPNLSVGIGTSTAVRVLYKEIIENIVINPIGFNSTGVSTATNEIIITDHELVTGDKVFYEDNILGTGEEYFIYKVDENTIKFCDTFKNANSNPPIVVSFASTGSSSQTISLINPQIQTVKNNNLVFDLSDSSLSGYEFKIYYDQEFNNEFVSTGSTSSFNISGVGTVGIASTASLTINYSSNFPQNLYYSLEKSGYISTSDKDVLNHSEISYIDSNYNGEYKVSDVGITTFKISLENKPEKSSYVKSDCDIFEYFTTSTSASGPAEKIKLISGGSGYISLPVLDRIESDNGENLAVNIKSNNIGNIESVRVINQGFEYSSDRTLEPQTFISPKLSLESSNKIANVNVVDGGKGFVVAPDIVAVNSDTREAVRNGLLVPDIVATSISTVDIEVATKGISDAGVELFTVNNSNGISIKEVTSTPTGIFTCSITTPLSGFSENPFKAGDQVFIEGIQKFSSDGDGFNSSDYGYKFLNVKSYDTSFADHQVTIDVSNLTTNTGIAKTIQDSFGVVINKNDYPVFETTIEPSFFTIGETLISNGIERDLSVVNHDINTPLKLAGSYDLSVNEKISGKLSGNSAIIKSIINYSGNFDIDYSSKKNQGWTDEIGKLNEDHQVLSDNDYYQNLSYSVKSSQQWKDIRTPVNSLVHISGLKNFSDTEILTVADKIGLGGTDQTTVIKDYFSENRVDTINIFDFVKDIDTFSEKSKFIKLLNKKLTNFTEIGSNIVLRIDDISSQFSNFDSEPNPYVDFVELDNTDSYLNYLIKVSDLSGNEIQLTNVIIVNDNIKNNSFILEKQSLTNLTSNTQYGDFSIESNSFGERYLRFTPEDPFNTEYDIKYIEKRFISGTGIGTTSVGFVDLTSNRSEVSSGTTSTVLEFSASDISSFFVSANIIQSVTNEINFVELYVTHDGTNTNISEYYIANDLVSGASFDQIGVGFTANISSGTLSLDYYNDSSLDITIDSRSIGFSTPPGVGIGSTYRFLADAQPEGSERSAIYESIKYSTSSGLSTTVVSLDKNLFDAVNSIVEITTGSTKSTHQVFLVQDGTDIYTQQYSIISIGSTIGIGTFGGEYVGTDNFELKFYPDSNFTGNIDLLSLNECLYKTVDFSNQYLDLNFGFSNESVKSTAYFAINGDRTNRVNFKLNNNNTPIFAKTFNPSKSNVLNASTGTFTIENNFFSNGEELVYTPGSTFVGVGSTSMLFDNGSFVAELPSQVFAVVGSGNTNNFQISTTRSGSPVTFASVGEGNAHKFAMAKRNEKSIITIDNIVQYPIAFTKISQNLTKNISETDTFFTLSGISTINPLDILRIDDEYMNIVNVGLGTVDVGPITNTGSELLVEVERGFVGSSASSHTNTTPTRIYKGSYDIVGDEIYFTKPPRGNPTIVRDGNNLVQETSDFTGRVFLRSNYDTSQVYDDISDEFTGIGRTFTLTVGGANTTGIGSTGGNGIVFLNGIFQTPTTSNNPENNFQIIDNSVIGISSIVFSGIRTDIDDPNSNLIIESDVNQNQLPRGGIIVSLGSSGGLGYAPLAGAAVTAVISGGVIQNSIGIGTTDISGSGYNNVISIGVTAFDPTGAGSGALISASVGAGGTLSFNVTNGGGGYSDETRIYVSEPSYENLEITGISRLGVGSTTESGIGLLLDVEVGASSTTGIGSTYFEVTNFSIKRNGYSFRRGDIFTPVGLVTDGRLSSPLSQFQLTVLDTFSDNFGAWQFGELDFIDSLKNYQDGVRVTFPLFYNSSLLSFELSEDNTSIELANSLIIFINGVLQDPGVSYTFEGGTSFTFSTAPKPEDNIAVFFYRGTRGLDDLLVTNVLPTLEKGDFVRVYKNNNINGTETQNQRTVFDLSFSDKFETNPYTSQGIDISNPKPMSWTKQKSDRIINGEFVYKTRQSIISQIYPTAKVIDSFSTSDTELFVDDADLFDYDSPDPFSAILVDNKETSKGEVTATISGGKVNGLSITNSGSGYEPGATINIGFAAPLTIGVGVGTTATATITVNSSGSLTSPTITNPGLGYTTEPLTIVPAPESNIESISAINSVKGFSGIITGIEATTNGGQSALKFNLKTSGVFNNGTNTLSVGYPILVKNTNVGSGAVSVDSTDSDVVAIGTAFFDNIYYVHQISDDGGLNGIATCNISSSTDTSSLPVSGDIVGEFSWGRLNITQRSSGPISIAVTGKTVDVGLSTFPTIQRRSQGLRQTGSIIERLD